MVLMRWLARQSVIQNWLLASERRAESSLPLLPRGWQARNCTVSGRKTKKKRKRRSGDTSRDSYLRCPMMALLKGEAGDAVVAQFLIDHPGECYAHVFNLTEVYYLFYRQGGASAADTAVQTLLKAGIIPREDA